MEGLVNRLAGSGLGEKACYLKQPELTGERYMRNMFVNAAAPVGQRIFRTGDGARFLPDGQIELVGRVAFMVKLRGYRYPVIDVIPHRLGVTA